MALRYSKLHRLPFPSYDVETSEGGPEELQIDWRNGPPGENVPTATEICVRFSTATSAETCLSIPLNLETYLLTFSGATKQLVQIRLRRENSAGFGDYTPWVEGTIG